MLLLLEVKKKRQTKIWRATPDYYIYQLVHFFHSSMKNVTVEFSCKNIVSIWVNLVCRLELIDLHLAGFRRIH